MFFYYYDKFEKFMITLIIVLGVLVVTYCGYVIYNKFKPPVITEGVITNKKHTPSRCELNLIPVSTGKITTVTCIPYFYKENWKITIQKDNKVETFYIDKSQWEKLNIGNQFKFTKDKGTHQEPKVKITNEQYNELKSK